MVLIYKCPNLAFLLELPSPCFDGPLTVPSPIHNRYKSVPSPRILVPYRSCDSCTYSTCLRWPCHALGLSRPGRPLVVGTSVHPPTHARRRCWTTDDMADVVVYPGWDLRRVVACNGLDAPSSVSLCQRMGRQLFGPLHSWATPSRSPLATVRDSSLPRRQPWKVHFRSSLVLLLSVFVSDSLYNFICYVATEPEIEFTCWCCYELSQRSFLWPSITWLTYPP